MGRRFSQRSRTGGLFCTIHRACGRPWSRYSAGGRMLRMRINFLVASDGHKVNAETASWQGKKKCGLSLMRGSARHVRAALQRRAIGPDLLCALFFVLPKESRTYADMISF